jgi:prevent-host-death family protein
MTERFSISQARDKLTSLVRRVEANRPIELTRRGKTVAVLMSAEEYQRLTTPERGYWDVYQAFRSAVHLKEMAITAEDFADLRDRSAGRDWGPDAL